MVNDIFGNDVMSSKVEEVTVEVENYESIDGNTDEDNTWGNQSFSDFVVFALIEFVYADWS